MGKEVHVGKWDGASNFLEDHRTVGSISYNTTQKYTDTCLFLIVRNWNVVRKFQIGRLAMILFSVKVIVEYTDTIKFIFEGYVIKKFAFVSVNL